jgi:hypothetical protein
MKSTFTVLILIHLLCCFSLALSTSKKSQAFLSLAAASAKIQITVDNILERLTIGGIDVDLSSFINKGDWTKSDTVTVDYKIGDSIEIQGKNINAYNQYNPGAILAAIIYTDDANNETKILTNASDWLCNDAVPYSFGKNGSGIWGKVAGIDDNAEWIWTQDLTVCKVVCKYIPPPIPQDVSDC